MKIDFIYDKILNNNIDAFNIDDDPESECETLFRMAQNFNQMNSDLNKLARLDITSLDDTISLKSIASDIENMIALMDKNLYVLSLDMNNFESDLFKFAKFNFYQDNYSITLAFSFPIYKNITLFDFYKKPIVKNNKNYLLNTSYVFYSWKTDFRE